MRMTPPRQWGTAAVGLAVALLAVVSLLGCRDGAVVGDDDAPSAASAAAECVVRATVVRSEDGAPLAGARVRLVSGRKVVAGPTATGDDGRVEFTHVAPTQYLMAIAEADGRGTVDEIASTLFGCSQGTTVVPERDVVIRLPEAGPVTGRVLAPDGTPMDGAEIEIHRTSDVRPPRGTSDSDGRFRIEGVPLGQSVSVVCGPLGPSKRRLACFEPPAWAPPATMPSITLTRDARTADVELRLRDVGILALTVLDPDGARIPSADLDLEALAGQIAPKLSISQGRLWRSFEPGRYRLAVRAAGFDRCAAREIEIPEGGTCDVEIRLSRPPK